MTDSNIQLFEQNGNGFIELIYPPNNGMSAKDVGEAILGMQLCLEEIAKITKFKDIEIVVFPIEPGSLKTKFAYVKKHGWKIIIGADIVFNLLNNAFDVIGHFGANKTHNLTSEVVQYSPDINVLELCKSKNFIYGTKKIVGPLAENIEKLEIRYGQNGMEVRCENRQKFFEELEPEFVLPELQDGKLVTIAGEITRINKGYGDLGFKYKDRTLKCMPFDFKTSITQFHEFLEENQVLLTGTVKRDGLFDLPEIKIIAIETIKPPDQTSIFDKE